MENSFKRWKELPTAIKLVAKYYQWIIYDLRMSGNTDSFEETTQMRIWLMNTLEARGLKRDDIPEINERNFFSTWFECERMLNIPNLKSMKHEFYEMKNYGRYYQAVEITQEKI